jgi:ATP-binding cassette subfamily B protein
MSMRNYDLQEVRQTRESQKTSWWSDIRKLSPLVVGEFRYFPVIILAVLINIGSSVLTPYLISRAIDGPIARGNISDLLMIVSGLVGLYFVASVASYFQARVMGHVSQRVLYRLRERLFLQLQYLPVAFFHQNKTGDLISRLNNDTEKINQFLSEGVLRFTSLFFSVLGIAGMMLWLEWKMALVVFGLTGLILGLSSGLNRWIRHLNTIALEEQGNVSAEVQEALNNYRVLVAFGKQEFFRENFSVMSERLRLSKTRAEVSSSLLAPLYTFGSNIAQGLVLLIGVVFLLNGDLTIGVLVGFVAYTQKFFEPLRILGAIVGTMQTAIAGWGRVNDVLSLKSDLTVIESSKSDDVEGILSFEDVGFRYASGSVVLENVSLNLCPGKTYALVGPTGGGKSTTASLMARLYDPTQGVVKFDGKDIRSYQFDELAERIGFILQEPVLFAGTLEDNLTYGNTRFSKEDLQDVLEKKGLDVLLDSFAGGLSMDVAQAEVSLGQRQLISFVRAVLREPELLILDEATANIDTVTEGKLQKALDTLPPSTTKVVIAHRLSTIREADQIYFVGGGQVDAAGSYQDVLERLS